jgi:tetratricopeptide (TPR) repeat protein
MRYLGNFLSVIFCLVASVSLSLAAGPQDNLGQADGLLASPTLDYPQAQQALALYEGLPQNSPQLLVRLSRTCFILGDLAPTRERAPYYEKGLNYAQRLLALDPSGVAGYYWKAMNLSGLADVGTEMQGFKLLPKIMEALKRAVALDETYDEAGAHRVLGRIYFQAPPWPISVGDKKKSLANLTAAVRLAPNFSTNHLYLAETLRDMGQKAQAKAELEKVLQDGQHALTPRDLREDRQEATKLLQELQEGR